jgi:hypothetical protein
MHKSRLPGEIALCLVVCALSCPATLLRRTTLEQVVACFESPEYQHVASFRRAGGGAVENVMVDGGDATQ